MKQKIKQLATVNTLAEHKEHAAKRLLAECSQALQLHRQQLQRLVSFKENYKNYIGQSSQEGIPAVKLQNLSAFKCSLDKTIEQQTVLLDQFISQQQQAQLDWQKAKLYHDNLQSLLCDAQSEFQAVKDKYEQIAIDEMLNNHKYS